MRKMPKRADLGTQLYGFSMSNRVPAVRPAPVTAAAAPVATAAAPAASAVAPASAHHPVAVPGPDLTGSPCLLDAGDRQVQVLLTMDLPRVVLFGGLLSDEECEAMITAAQTKGLTRSNVISDNGGEERHAERTSEGMYFQRGESDLIRRLETRIARLLHWPVDNGEGLQILHYRPGAEYRPHYDYFLPESPGTVTHTAHGGQRVGTLILYLNDVPAGGATIFPDVHLSILPRRGYGVFFSYDRPDPATLSLHGGSPVVSGDKWIATKWLRERPYI